MIQSHELPERMVEINGVRKYRVNIQEVQTENTVVYTYELIEFPIGTPIAVCERKIAKKLLALGNIEEAKESLKEKYLAEDKEAWDTYETKNCPECNVLDGEDIDCEMCLGSGTVDKVKAIRPYIQGDVEGKVEALIKVHTDKTSREDKLKYLSDTDWYTVRYAETGVEVPDEVLSKRQEIRESL